MNPSIPQHVVLVGHCGPDEWMIKAAVGRSLPNASIEMAHNDTELDTFVTEGSLCLLNRVLDGDFEATHGQDLIKAILTKVARPMLVSNFKEAQVEAVAAGALPGFGKSELNVPQTVALLQEAFA
jgi:two-component system chemotaxis response regulator CheY